MSKVVEYNSIKKDRTGIVVEVFNNIDDPNGFNVKNVSYTVDMNNTIRGLDFINNVDQERLITCVSGSYWVNIVDFDPNSENFGKTVYSDKIRSYDNITIKVPKMHGLGYRSFEDNSRMMVLSNVDTDLIIPDDDVIIVYPIDDELGLSWNEPWNARKDDFDTFTYNFNKSFDWVKENIKPDLTLF